MEIHEHATPDKLERYTFLWSVARLVIAAVSLIVGGYPIAVKIIPIPLTYSLLTLCWIASGVSAVYLGYRWHTGGQKLFGTHDKRDRIAFLVLVISGINLGIVGLIGTNIGMSISGNKIVYLVTGILYLASAYHLHTRWKSHGERIF